MRLCAGTAKGIVIIDPERGGRPLMALADPPSVWCMARDAGDPNLLFAGAVHNAFAGSARGRAALARSTDGGRSWSDITPGAARDEEVWAVAAAPGRSGTIYIGTSRARIFRSENAGASFRECAAPLRLPARDRFGAAAPRAAIRAIRFSPRDASVIHVVLEAAGVFRSTDGARSFEPLARPAAEEFHDLAIDPEDSSRLIVATGAGVYFSTTGGASWSRAAGLIREWAIALLFAGAGVGRSVFASAAAVPPPLWAMGPMGADAMIFRSLDQGRTFAPLIYADGAARPGRGAAMRFAMNPEDPNDLFAAVSDGSILRIDAATGATRLIAERLPPVYDVLAIP